MVDSSWLFPFPLVTRVNKFRVTARPSLPNMFLMPASRFKRLRILSRLDVLAACVSPRQTWFEYDAVTLSSVDPFEDQAIYGETDNNHLRLFLFRIEAATDNLVSLLVVLS